jgi:hypothetical protein
LIVFFTVEHNFVLFVFSFPRPASQMLANQRSYREVANLLDAVKQFMTHFDKYVHIPVIQNIEQRVLAIRATLTGQISGTFRQLAKVRKSSVFCTALRNFWCSQVAAAPFCGSRQAICRVTSVCSKVRWFGCKMCFYF